jgi:hypothetical protein
VDNVLENIIDPMVVMIWVFSLGGFKRSFQLVIVRTIRVKPLKTLMIWVN